MYIRKSEKTVKGKTYTNYVLVESVMTPKGPRQRTICSLGNLKPRPMKEWLALAHKVEEALVGQMHLGEQDPEVRDLVERVHARQREEAGGEQRTDTARQQEGGEDSEVVAVVTGRVENKDIREAGAVNVGLHFYNLLCMDKILAESGLSGRALLLTKAMVLNRLIEPASEHATPDWIGRTCLADVLGPEVNSLGDDALYRNLDRLHGRREFIERALGEREKQLFGLQDTIFLYDLTSTYFEGRCPKNPMAKRGYSRDKRSDCKQVVVGLVVDPDGFPKAHEVFDGNRSDTTTVEEMLSCLEQRVGKGENALVVVDRGMASKANLETIRQHGYRHLVASRQQERERLREEFESETGWSEVVRTPSPSNPCQRKARVDIRRYQRAQQTLILCVSEGRKDKDKAIREKQEKRFLEAFRCLAQSVQQGRLKEPGKIHQKLGRLQERYPRVARYYEMDLDSNTGALSCVENTEKKSKAQRLDGSYILQTDRTDLNDEEVWLTYSLLTRVENAFRNMKSPLAERPIWHQLPHRVESHIFLCLLAYHLLVSIEKTLLDQGIHTSWATVRDIVSTHHVVTTVLPASNGDVLEIRQASSPDPDVAKFYQLLGVPAKFMKPVKTWFRKAFHAQTKIVTE